jgi:predicted nuclease of predicted toxin-antitoxin system
MGTLSSELAPHADRLSPHPRIYADANVPSGLVAHMRDRLGWDVFFVLEEEELRRAPDLRHYRLARQLNRTLVTLDRDYLDDSRFLPQEGGGVVVLSAPNERELRALIGRVGRTIFGVKDGDSREVLPLDGRKLHVHTDWGRGRLETGD